MHLSIKSRIISCLKKSYDGQIQTCNSKKKKSELWDINMQLRIIKFELCDNANGEKSKKRQNNLFLLLLFIQKQASIYLYSEQPDKLYSHHVMKWRTEGTMI